MGRSELPELWEQPGSEQAVHFGVFKPTALDYHIQMPDDSPDLLPIPTRPPSSGCARDLWPHLAGADADAVHRHAAALIAADTDDRTLAQEAQGCWALDHVAAGLSLATIVREHGNRRRDLHLRREAIRCALVHFDSAPDRDVAALIGFGLAPPLPDDADLAAMVAHLVSRMRSG